MATVITEEQRIELEASPRYQAVCKQYVKFIAEYLIGQDGTPGSLGGRSNPVNWAKERVLAGQIAARPNDWNYTDWAAQMTMKLKGQSIWETTADATITAMIASGKFEDITNQTYALRASKVEF